MFNIKDFLGLSTYISALDQYLTHFDRTHPQLSASQRKEKEKYAEIHKLRDKPGEKIVTSSIWDKF